MSFRILILKKQRGIAGQIAVTASVKYEREDGSEQDDVTFVGSAYGTPGPVVLVSRTFGQTFVTNPERFGETFGEDWVRRFYA